MNAIQVVAAWLLKNMSILRLLARLLKALLLGEKIDVGEELRTEIAAINAATEARKVEIRHGAEEALKRIEWQHAEGIKVLAEKEQARVEELRNDPPKLALAAVRAARAARLARERAGN